MNPVQELCGEFPQNRSLEAHPAGSAAIVSEVLTVGMQQVRFPARAKVKEKP